MTVLGHGQLIEALARPTSKKRLIVTPLLSDTQIGPASIDLRLGTDFIEMHRLERRTLDPMSKPDEPRVREERVVVPLGEELILHPGQFILGVTFEYLRMPSDLAGQVLNRSSWARMGLLVATAVFVQPGYSGTLTLELVNMGTVPMTLRPGLRIAQLIVFALSVETDQPYSSGGKYSAPLGPQSSRLGAELREWERIKQLGQSLHRPLP